MNSSISSQGNAFAASAGGGNMPWSWFVRSRLQCVLIACAIATGIGFPVRAAMLDGVEVPDTVQVDGKILHLNGFGLRTWSILNVHIYVAALYLEHPSNDPAAILNSPQTKLLTVNFLRGVSADQARDSWREGFANNCQPPCALNPQDVATFLASVPDMRAGDQFALLFTGHGAEVDIGGRRLGVISNPTFAKAMLATFLGPRPGTESLKRDLLNTSALQTSR
jgi:hypothetical protein